MIPWEILDEKPVPDGGTMQLARRGEEYVIRVDRKDLMSSRMSGSERALAETSCAGAGAGFRALVGGLGLGYTLRAALDQLPDDSEVVVAELVPAVIAWNRDLLGHLADHPLDDARTTVFEGDVRKPIQAPGTKFDAIMLDVDNGPEGLSHEANGWLYQKAGIAACKQALRPKGVLAIWSAFDDPRFTRRLKEAGFSVELLPVRAHGKKGAKHYVWLAR
ncbi:MAG: hypothetical protein R3E66_11495 [bacterium]